MGKKSYRSIRVKLLTWFMGISIVSLSVLGGIVYVNIRGILDNRIRNELNISARGIEGKVAAFIEGKKGRTLDFCSDGIVKDGLTYYDPDDPAFEVEDEDVFKRGVKRHLIFGDVVVSALDKSVNTRVIGVIKGQPVLDNTVRTEINRFILFFFNKGRDITFNALGGGIQLAFYAFSDNLSGSARNYPASKRQRKKRDSRKPKEQLQADAQESYLHFAISLINCRAMILRWIWLVPS